jgi:hypothetical protein
MSSILITWFNSFSLYYANFFSTGSTLSSSKIFSFLLWSKNPYPAVRLVNFISVVFILISLCFSVQIYQPCKSDGIGEIYTLNWDYILIKLGFRTSFTIPNICKKKSLTLMSCPFRVRLILYISNLWTHSFVPLYYLLYNFTSDWILSFKRFSFVCFPAAL